MQGGGVTTILAPEPVSALALAAAKLDAVSGGICWLLVAS